jgi:hypothetical protein
MHHECVGIVLSVLVDRDTRLADGKLGDKVRGFEGKEGKEIIPFPLLKVCVSNPMVGTYIFMDQLKASLPKPVAS